MGTRYPAAIHFHFGQRQPKRRNGTRRMSAVAIPARPGDDINPRTSGQWPVILYLASRIHQGVLRRIVVNRKVLTFLPTSSPGAFERRISGVIPWSLSEATCVSTSTLEITRVAGENEIKSNAAAYLPRNPRVTLMCPHHHVEPVDFRCKPETTAEGTHQVVT